MYFFFAAPTAYARLNNFGNEIVEHLSRELPANALFVSPLFYLAEELHGGKLFEPIDRVPYFEHEWSMNYRDIVLPRRGFTRPLSAVLSRRAVPPIAKDFEETLTKIGTLSKAFSRAVVAIVTQLRAEDIPNAEDVVEEFGFGLPPELSRLMILSVLRSRIHKLRKESCSSCLSRV